MDLPLRRVSAQEVDNVLLQVEGRHAVNVALHNLALTVDQELVLSGREREGKSANRKGASDWANW